MNIAAQYKLDDRLEPGEVIASRYVVEQLWRQHALGELYRCRDLQGGGMVTLQRLRREFASRSHGREDFQPGAPGPQLAERLLDSLHRAAPGTTLLPDILDHGADFDGHPFLVWRSQEAMTLAELERPLAFTEVLAIIEAIATALIPAHAERLVHGGIEPASVLLERDADGRPRVVALLGFGLIPALQGIGGKSRSLALLMSPTHIAPELIRGAPLSPAADVYALGISLWELIHGAPPFRGPTLRVLDAHQRRALPELELPFDVPPSFDWVLRRMLAKDPVDRFADAAAVVEQLRRFADDAIPDLTLELEPEPEPEPEIADEDDERTILFDRLSPAVSPTPRPSCSTTAETVSELMLVSLPRPPWAKWVAIGSIAAAGMLIVLQALAGTPIEPAKPESAAVVHE